MEMRRTTYLMKPVRAVCFIILLWITAALSLCAQVPVEKYIIKDGKMQIELSKLLDEAALDSFIAKFDLFDLDLKHFIKTNSPDSLQKLGWKLEKNNREQFVISKLLRGFDNFNNPADKILFTQKEAPFGVRFPAINTGIKYGYNRFRKKSPFRVNDSLVTFQLRNNGKARQVMLAGSFNEWDPGALAMRNTDSGWIALVILGPGKYLYKFIVDGNWTIDHDNERIENDGLGNNNSVFFKPNKEFRLNGFPNAKKVFVAGSFNEWRPRELQLAKTTAGWQLPLYLAEGTHTYRFVVDGDWMADPANKDRLPNEFNDFNSVIQMGTPYTFKLNGYTNSKQVVLAGSFNNWRKDELFMKKTVDGWELPYTLAAGNYEYRYIADGKWVTGNGNASIAKPGNKEANADLVILPNYTFRLKGFPAAKNVFLAGDFNNWSPATYSMKRAGDEWLFSVHLSPGKHMYKFVVDGKWITDPANKLWEQNEHGTGNSVVWFKN